ncbi:MAG: arginine N-succinyltransferase, partial [Sphingomonas sp.]
FAYENYVDIFDGGPTMTARTDQVRTIREAQTSTIVAVQSGGKRALAATGQWQDFRAAFAHVELLADGVAIDADAAHALNVGPGDSIDWIGT